MITLYQTEWCPSSMQVRMRLTEAQVDFIARQVPAEPAQRHAMRAATGGDGVPTLVAPDGTCHAGVEACMAYLDATAPPGPDAAAHRARAARARTHLIATWTAGDTEPHT